jgi:hypothetical protein
VTGKDAISSAGTYVTIRKEAKQLFTRTSHRVIDQRGTIHQIENNSLPFWFSFKLTVTVVTLALSH